mmetsp:Transcript_18893/g.47482  ORF Transcript_18893/g.47482 Transcript_18893/m.47482 type:complete len:89 (-) Transcript_18893:68-334(-)
MRTSRESRCSTPLRGPLINSQPLRNNRNAVLVNAYIASNSKLTGVIIDGADFTDVLLRQDQINYLCKRASGTNPVTGVETKESLMCME